MKFRCTRERLAKAASIVGRAVSARSTLPILGNFLIEATTDGQMRLAATDLAIRVDCWFPAHVDVPGAITLPARLFGDIIGKANAPEIAIETNERTQSAQIKCGGFDGKILGLDAADFPAADAGKDEAIGDLDVAMTREMIELTAFAASTDQSRQTLLCVNITLGKGRIVMAATDGFRLAVRRAPLDYSGAARSLLVRATSMTELARILGEADDEQPLAVRVAANRVLFAVMGKGGQWRAEFAAQLNDANFPDYHAIIPKSSTTTVALHTVALQRGMALARLFTEARGDSRRVTLAVDPASNRLSISAANSLMGNSADGIDAEVKGSPLVIGIDIDFLIEAVGKVRDPQVVLEMSSPARPITVRPFAASPDEFVHVIMPMHADKK